MKKDFFQEEHQQVKQHKPVVWVLTDGKMGDRVPCLGIAECLDFPFDEKIISSPKMWAWFAPWGPIAPSHKANRANSPIAPPFSDIAIASGRRMVPYLRALKRASGNRTFTVFLKDPHCSVSCADLIWVPQHDKLRGKNVVVTPTSPHRIRFNVLQKIRSQPLPQAWNLLPKPRLGLVIGDPLSYGGNQQKALTHFLEKIDNIKFEVGSWLVVRSRRTPDALIDALTIRLQGVPSWIWSGVGDNPYLDVLAHADMLAVTADSHNMLSEALSTGRPVFPIKPLVLNPKLHRFLCHVESQKLVRTLPNKLEFYSYEPVDATQEIATVMLHAFKAHRHRYSGINVN